MREIRASRLLILWPSGFRVRWPYLALFAVVLLCVASRESSAAVQWNRVGTVTTLTSGQLCTDDGKNIYCDTTTPTVSGGKVGVGSTAPIVSLDLSQNPDALALPTGTSGQRPTGVNLTPGEIRYDSSGTGSVEAYYNSGWNTFLTSGTVGSSMPAAGNTGDIQFNNGGVLGGSDQPLLGQLPRPRRDRDDGRLQRFMSEMPQLYHSWNLIMAVTITLFG